MAGPERPRVHDMMASLGSDLERFRSSITARLGLQFEDTKLGFLAEVLDRRVKAVRSSADAYLRALETGDGSREEIRALAGELTVAETYFFRHAEQLDAFGEVALPERTRAQVTRRTLRILSAGCASGEESYSLAMLVRERLPDAATWQVSVHGVDVNPAMLEKAERARYAAWSLRETPDTVRQRWFRAEGREFVLGDSIRAMVRFEERNLIEDDPMFWRPEAFDVAFCRNVLMYFTPQVAEAVVGRIARALVPGGYLFLGHAETLRGLSTDFHLRHTHETFYYQRRMAFEEPASDVTTAPTRSAATLSTVPLAAVVDATDSWVDVIRQASERVDALTGRPTRPAVAPGEHTSNGASRIQTPTPRWDLGLAMGLLRQERFAEAEAVMRAMPPEAARDPDVLLLQAVLLAHTGHLVEAERVCADLLAIDEMSAGAHYVVALCREHVGDHAGAISHDQVAAYLDPGFAMPHLHWGLLARRTKDRPTACQELRHALTRLAREDASRLLLFGGGFSREALIALCEAEIVACGGGL